MSGPLVLEAIEARARAYAKYMEVDVLDELLDDVPDLIAEVRRLRREYTPCDLDLLTRAEAAESALADFRDHGLRCDLNPTRRLGDDGFWTNYIRRADEGIRERAATALNARDAALILDGHAVPTEGPDPAPEQVQRPLLRRLGNNE